LENDKPDMKTDSKAVVHRNEPISLMEPLLVTFDFGFSGEINDLTVELAARAAGFRRSMPTGIIRSLVELSGQWTVTTAT
jgi:hypothetical protein